MDQFPSSLDAVAEHGQTVGNPGGHLYGGSEGIIVSKERPLVQHYSVHGFSLQKRDGIYKTTGSQARHDIRVSASVQLDRYGCAERGGREMRASSPCGRFPGRVVGIITKIRFFIIN